MKRGRPRKWSISEEVAGQLREASKQAGSAKDKERLQAGLLAAQGVLSLEQIAEAVGRARSCVQRWLDKLQEGGVAGLLERGQAPGALPALDPSQQERLRAELKGARHRTAGQIGRWIKEQLGVSLSQAGVYYWLGKLAAVLRVPRPQHRRHDAARAADFRAALRESLHQLNVPGKRPVRIWLQDEGRFGLHGFARRVWTLPGIKPVVPTQQRYEWFYAFAALECTQGSIEVAYWDGVELPVTLKFLEQIAASEPGAEHVIIYDGAGFHPKPGVHTLPEHVHVILLPPYSPELNPVENLWDLLRDEVCNKAFDHLADLQERLTTALQTYRLQSTKVSSLIHGWIKRTVNAFSPNIIPAFN
jgi:transposase